MNIEDRIAELKEVQEEEKERKKQEKNDNWKPKLNEEYYFFNGFMEIYGTIWLNTESDNMRYMAGGCFKTKEEAVFTFERLKVIHELKRFTRPYKHGEDNYYLFYFFGFDNENGKRLEIGSSEFYTFGNLYFESEEKVIQAIEEIGGERIKKYYLQVQED